MHLVRQQEQHSLRSSSVLLQSANLLMICLFTIFVVVVAVVFWGAEDKDGDNEDLSDKEDGGRPLSVVK